MKSVRTPFASLNALVLAGLLATVGASAMAQTPPPPPAGAPVAGHHDSRMGGRHDPAKMQAWIAKRQADLKAKLKITPAQEGAWTTFTASMQPPARMGERPSAEQQAQRRAEFEKLTTPQRIDKMREMHAQRSAERNAAMQKRGEAVKTFYAALTPEQQKTFDAQPLPHGHHGGPGGDHGHGGPRGHGPKDGGAPPKG